MKKKQKINKSVISVDGQLMKVGTSLRYLGFHLNKGLSMSHHLKTVCEKTKKVAGHFRSILPNVNGPTFLKCLLVVNAVLSILWYGVEIWAFSINKKKNLKLITSTIRPLKRTLCGAYRTVSNMFLDALSDMPCTELLIETKIEKNEKNRRSHRARHRY